MNQKEIYPSDNPELISTQKLLEELHLHQAELEMQNDELRIANEKLELQQMKFASVYDMGPIGFYILDKTGIITDVNLAGISLLETGKASILRSRLQSFIAADYSDTFHKYFRELLSSGDNLRCHLKMVSKKGRDFYVQIEGVAITPSNILPRQCNMVITDITERVLAEKSLAKTTDRLKLALKASSAGTWELDLETLNFCIDNFNYQNCIIPNGKFTGQYQDFINLIHSQDRAMVDQQFRIAINSQKEVNLVCRLYNDQNNICYLNFLGHVIIEQGQSSRFVGIITDISEKRRMEDESIRLRNEQHKNIALATINAEQNERTRLSESLHDSLSQLLYGIRLHLSSLLDADEPKEVLRNVYDLLDAAVKETRNISFELSPSILTDFGLRVALEELASRLSSGKVLIRTKLTRLTGRLNLTLESTIFRIVQELINNSLKHSEATIIGIEIKMTSNIKIIVSDNGKGFKQADLEKSSPSGSGLSSVTNRLNIYNGNMNIQPNPGGGTLITINLDLVAK